MCGIGCTLIYLSSTHYWFYSFWKKITKIFKSFLAPNTICVLQSFESPNKILFYIISKTLKLTEEENSNMI